jgi:hypothetical protein
MQPENREFAIRIKPVGVKLLLGAMFVLDCLDCRLVRAVLGRRIAAGGKMPVALPDASAYTSWVVRTGKRDLATARQHAEANDRAAPEMHRIAGNHLTRARVANCGKASSPVNAV